MSTSPSLEITKPTEGGLPSLSLNEDMIPEKPRVEHVEEPTSEQPKVTEPVQEPNITPLGEQKSPTEPKSIGEQNVSTDPKLVSPPETSNNQKLEETTDSKMPEENEIQAVLEKIVKNVDGSKKESPQEKTENVENFVLIENKTGTKNPGQEPVNGPDANENAGDVSVKTDQEKAKESLESEKPIKNDEAGQVMINGNEQKEPQEENANQEENQDADTSDCVNIQELTEHVMNILNDGVVEDVVTEQQLLKKNVDLQQFIVKLIHLLKEKTDLCANLDRQNSALISQAQSLKDVIAITKDLLGIRNMEIEHLHADLAAMEDSIKEERTRHNLSVQRLNEAMSLNDKLKTEYLNQMDLFQKLREKYTEKVVYLTRENLRLNALFNPNEQVAEANPEESNVSDLESSQNESVDK